MNAHITIYKLFRRARPAPVILSALGILAGVYGLGRWLQPVAMEEKLFQHNLSKLLEQTAAAREHMGSLEMLKTTDLEQLKMGLGGHALTEKSLFESGLSL